MAKERSAGGGGSTVADPARDPEPGPAPDRIRELEERVAQLEKGLRSMVNQYELRHGPLEKGKIFGK